MWGRFRDWRDRRRTARDLRRRQRDWRRAARAYRTRRGWAWAGALLSPLRLADPRFYLSAVIVLSAFGLVVLPIVADGTLAVAKPFSTDGRPCRVLRVVDGDTVQMFCGGRGLFRARLTGFDAPELFSPKCMSERIAAFRAKWALRRMIFSAERMTLVFRGTDRYGRRLVAMMLDGRPVAARMIAAGHARAYAGGRRKGWCT